MYLIELLSQCPAGTGALCPVSLPALTSVLMDITFTFMHLCTQSALAWGMVSHQYILQLHSSQPQIGEIINTTAQWSPLCRNQFNQVATTANSLLRCVIGCSQVCLFLCKHHPEDSVSLARGKLENSHILAERDWEREKMKAWWELIFPYWRTNWSHTHTHTHTPLLDYSLPPIDQRCQ